MANDNRIQVLDSFRFFAILSVMLFHYYSLWFPPNYKMSYYPYGDSYNYFSLGWLGVEFFFIISGFVIAFTLTNTDSFIEFWKKRLIRLLPPVFLCSLITLSVFQLIDTEHVIPKGGSITNFLYSITLISPDILNGFMRHFLIHGDYINGSYWSLWPEIQFYVVASCIYFINRRKFVRNIFLINILLLGLNFVLSRILENTLTTNRLHLPVSNEFVNSYLFWTKSVFNYLRFSLFFLMGVLFYNIYSKNELLKSLLFLGITVILQLYYFYRITNGEFLPLFIIGLMILLLLIFAFYSQSLNFLAVKPLTNIGIASYSLYLIHESIGVLLIHKYGSYFYRFDFLFPLFIIVIMMIYSLYSYKYIEKPIGLFLKKVLINK